MAWCFFADCGPCDAVGVLFLSSPFFFFPLVPVTSGAEVDAAEFWSPVGVLRRFAVWAVLFFLFGFSLPG